MRVMNRQPPGTPEWKGDILYGPGFLPPLQPHSMVTVRVTEEKMLLAP